MSIRYKFIISLLALTAICLGIYILIAKSVFEKDKEVAVFESVSQTSDAHANAIKQSLEENLSFATSLVSTWDDTTQSLSKAGFDLFTLKKDLLSFGVYQSGRFTAFASKDTTITQDTITRKFKSPQPVIVPFDDTGIALITTELKKSDIEPDQYLILVVNLNPHLNMLNFSNEHGGSFVTIHEKVFSNIKNFPYGFAQKFIAALPLQKNMGEQTSIEKIDNHEYLISSKDIPFGDLQIFSVVPKDTAFAGLNILYKKSLQFFALIFFIVLCVSVFMTQTLLKNLDKLTAATGEVSKGHFDLALGVQSKDEFGLLATSFQHMSQEIKRLIVETKEKARMEGELKTAQAVQENLFPTPYFRNNELEISGLYRSASECGGDWWFHFEHPTGVYVLICDATGHGAPAALITAAAKATVNLMKKEKYLTLQKLTSAFNYALYETARGNILMTGFAMHIKHDLSIDYVNASHEPPFIIQKGDVNFVIDPIGPRFGEKPEHEFQIGQINDIKNKTLILYTDGITGQTNKAGRALGDKRFTKYLQAINYDEATLESVNSGAFQLVDDFRKDSIQDDDLTIVTVRFIKPKD